MICWWYPCTRDTTLNSTTLHIHFPLLNVDTTMICVYRIFDQSLLIIEILNEVVALDDDSFTFESELQNIKIMCWTWSCCWLNKNRQNNSILLWREQSHPSRQLIITDPDTKIWNTLHLSFIMTHVLWLGPITLLGIGQFEIDNIL